MMLVAFRINDTRVFSRVVRFFRGGDSGHVEAALPDALYRHLHLCVSASFMDGGVRGKAIDITNPYKWRVYQVREHDDPLVWLAKNNDTFGLLVSTLPTLSDDPEKKVCSEAIAELLPWLPDPPRTYDLVKLENAVKQRGEQVQWTGYAWVTRTGS